MQIKLICVKAINDTKIVLFKCKESYWVTMRGCFHGFECSQEAVIKVPYRTIRFNTVPDYTSNDPQLATII